MRWSSGSISHPDRAHPDTLAIALYLEGSGVSERGARRTSLIDEGSLILVNAWWDPLGFVPPACHQVACHQDKATWRRQESAAA